MPDRPSDQELVKLIRRGADFADGCANVEEEEHDSIAFRAEADEMRRVADALDALDAVDAHADPGSARGEVMTVQQIADLRETAKYGAHLGIGGKLLTQLLDSHEALRSLPVAGNEDTVRARIKELTKPRGGFLLIDGREVYYRLVIEAFGYDAARSVSPERGTEK